MNRRKYHGRPANIRQQISGQFLCSVRTVSPLHTFNIERNYGAAGMALSAQSLGKSLDGPGFESRQRRGFSPFKTSRPVLGPSLSLTQRCIEYLPMFSGG